MKITNKTRYAIKRDRNWMNSDWFEQMDKRRAMQTASQAKYRAMQKINKQFHRLMADTFGLYNSTVEFKHIDKDAVRVDYYNYISDEFEKCYSFKFAEEQFVWLNGMLIPVVFDELRNCYVKNEALDDFIALHELFETVKDDYLFEYLKKIDN